MKKIFISIFIIFLVIPAVLSAANPSELEQQIERVRREREVLIEEQKKLQAELEEINKESQSLGSAVKSLDATKKKLAKDISITQSKITSTNLTIQSLENTMSKKEQQIITHRTAIANTILTLSEYDTRPLILQLLASTRLSDIWRDGSQLAGLNARLGKEIEFLRETRKVLNQEKVEKEKVKAEQVGLRGQLSGQKSVVEENQKAKEKLLVVTKNKEAAYQKLIQENIARQKESEGDLYRLEQELRITLDPSLFPEPKRGILAWPLDNIYITGRFGRSDCSIYGGADCFHNGLDFRASMGTPVRSMLSGVVDGTGNTDDQKACYSYGRWILVKHDNGLASIYAHLSASLVQKGQKITTGQIIGYSGGVPGVNGSGYSKGQHLHVGLFASQGVEIRQFTTSIGCKQVFVPIAKGRDAYLDPLAYLPVL
ncbi:MAG: peptidoglycan DD-metalloendopeptidase family protein [bacterium]|nr:peptidoglycan DD-metalloendopeptidase family protein [bacterium]